MDGNRGPELTLVVAAHELVADDVVLLSLRSADGLALPDWQPGAHVDLVLGADLVRQYSLCGDPGDRRTWQLAVQRDARTRGGSRHVHEALLRGATVTASHPRNTFPLEPAPDYLFLAGGIGITPLLPMLRAADEAGSCWRLLYGARTRSRMPFGEALEDRYPGRVELVPQDEQGLLPVAEALSGARPGTHVYCCGPKPLIEAVQTAHVAHGRGPLHVERFTPRPVGAAAATTFEVEAARSGTVVQVGRTQTVLDALRDGGVRVLASCEEGICGTCEVPVLRGLPEHRDSVLSDEERESSSTMLVCVSRSLSPRLVLDV